MHSTHTSSIGEWRTLGNAPPAVQKFICEKRKEFFKSVQRIFCPTLKGTDATDELETAIGISRSYLYSLQSLASNLGSIKFAFLEDALQKKMAECSDDPIISAALHSLKPKVLTNFRSADFKEMFGEDWNSSESMSEPAGNSSATELVPAKVLPRTTIAHNPLEGAVFPDRLTMAIEGMLVSVPDGKSVTVKKGADGSITLKLTAE